MSFSSERCCLIVKKHSRFSNPGSSTHLTARFHHRKNWIKLCWNRCALLLGMWNGTATMENSKKKKKIKIVLPCDPTIPPLCRMKKKVVPLEQVFLSSSIWHFRPDNFFVVKDCPVHYRIFSSIPAPTYWIPGATPAPQLWQPKMCPEIVTCPLGAQITPGSDPHCLRKNPKKPSTLAPKVSMVKVKRNICWSFSREWNIPHSEDECPPPLGWHSLN